MEFSHDDFVVSYEIVVLCMAIGAVSLFGIFDDEVRLSIFAGGDLLGFFVKFSTFSCFTPPKSIYLLVFLCAIT